MALIEVEKLEKIYEEGSVRTPALCGVSFSIREGEFVAVMGPSGSGKSTLLHVLGFLDRATSGSYRFDGKVFDDFSESEIARIRNEKIGFVFQAFNLLPRISVWENVKLPLYYSDIPESKWGAYIEEAIASVGLTHRSHHEASRLSGGEKQRAAIARALVLKPKVIFADEPTGNLDSKSGQVVMETIERLHRKDGHTIVLITHETYTAGYAGRIIELRDGVIARDQVVEHQHRSSDGFKK